MLTSSTTIPKVPVDIEACAVFLVNEEYKRGCGGVLYIADEKWVYLFPDEVPHVELSDQLQKTVADDCGAHFFVMVREPEGVNVFAISKLTAAAMAAKHVT